MTQILSVSGGFFWHMRTIDRVLIELESRKGEYISGEALATELGLSRNAVWKAIRELRTQGYDIDSASKRGYSLQVESDIISKEGIGACLEKIVRGGQKEQEKLTTLVEKISVYDTLESTNNTAIALMARGLDESFGQIVIAKSQSGGRGHGKSVFASPEGGVYLSVIMAPSYLPKSDISSDIYVKVARALEECSGIDVEVRVPDGIFYMDKKVGGIMTESIQDVETGEVRCYIVGIGISAEYFSRVETEGKNRLIAGILSNILL